MINALQSFQFGTAPLRVIQRQGEPWFVAVDICGVLGIKNARDAVASLDDDERDAVGTTDAIGRNQDMNIVSESGLYALIFKSRRPEARAFRKWVTSEVLPSIRRTGTFSLGEVDHRTIASAAKLIAEARHLRGKEAAVKVWESMGLPELLPAPGDAVLNDPLIDPITDMLSWFEDRAKDGVVQVTIQDMLDGLETPDADMTMRRRVGRVLKHLGYFSRKARHDGKVVVLFERVL